MADLSFGNKYAVVTPTGALKVDSSEVTQPVSGLFFPAVQPVSGVFWQAVQPVSGAFWPAVQPVSGTFWQAVQPISGTIYVLNLPLSVATVTRVAVGASAVTLVAANAVRRRAIIFNESGTLYVKFGPNASATDYTCAITGAVGNNMYTVENYSGIITGIKLSGASFAQVTEL